MVYSIELDTNLVREKEQAKHELKPKPESPHTKPNVLPLSAKALYIKTMQLYHSLAITVTEP